MRAKEPRMSKGRLKAKPLLKLERNSLPEKTEDFDLLDFSGRPKTVPMREPAKWFAA